MRYLRSTWHLKALVSPIFAFVTGTSCCFETVPVAECGDGDGPHLILTAVNLRSGELPVLVAGRACGGSSIGQEQLRAEYEVIVYAETNRYYVQPFADDFRHRLCESGYFEAESHKGTVMHAFLARRGLAWPATAMTLPTVDGADIIAEAEFRVEDPAANQ